MTTVELVHQLLLQNQPGKAIVILGALKKDELERALCDLGLPVSGNCKAEMAVGMKDSLYARSGAYRQVERLERFHDAYALRIKWLCETLQFHEWSKQRGDGGYLPLGMTEDDVVAELCRHETNLRVLLNTHTAPKP